MGVSPEQVRAFFESVGCESRLQDDEEAGPVTINQYLGDQFWTYFLYDNEEATYSTIILSYIGDDAPPSGQLDLINRFNDNAMLGRMFVNENGDLNLNAKIYVPEPELTEATFSTYGIAWISDYENMMRLIEQEKAN